MTPARGSMEVEEIMDGQTWLEDVRASYHEHKRRCERAAAQVSDVDFFARIGSGSNSIAIIMKHIGENHRSRWRDFLTTDGEKQDRRREDEFSQDGETRSSIEAKWGEGWRVADETWLGLQPSDLTRTITIRGEPMSVVQALHRNLTHLAYHTGQIVQLAQHFAGDAWQSLSVPPGKTDEFNAAMREKYGDWWAR